MKIAVYSTKSYDKKFLNIYGDQVKFNFLEVKLDRVTAVLAKEHDGICVFVNDILDREVLTILNSQGIKFIALRCAGFNNVDLTAAKELGMNIARVPYYSPESVAEHTVGMLLTLNRKFHKAYNRVRENNFSLDGLMGFQIKGKTIGIIGTGAIGESVIKIMSGFGVKILAYDLYQKENIHCEYVSLDKLFLESDIISLHCPLTPETKHIINKSSVNKMKEGVMIINTSRGGLINTSDIICSLKERHVSYLGIDVYEQESDLFFEDLSSEVVQDDEFQRLLTFPNVIITGHQAFFTQEALSEISKTTMENLMNMKQGIKTKNML